MAGEKQDSRDTKAVADPIVRRVGVLGHNIETIA